MKILRLSIFENRGFHKKFYKICYYTIIFSNKFRKTISKIQFLEDEIGKVRSNQRFEGRTYFLGRNCRISTEIRFSLWLTRVFSSNSFLLLFLLHPFQEFQCRIFQFSLPEIISKESCKNLRNNDENSPRTF